ncbi:MFS transporter [Comamonas testosteroni]|uniref:MFS transporter n=1 Tax=Comamonas testosteroni TaxID=285 RepID=UPI002E1634A0|nr:MFS transporter [Comamonas testosteroni]WQD41053.1 MFS transporter [Comamonas testosteroni]
MATTDGADHSSSRRVMLAMGVLYVGFGVLAALLQGGLPPVLRARGLSVAQIGWTFALYLPIGLSFLWAPLVDRIRLPFLSPRISWIVLAQLAAVAGLIAVAMLEHAPMALLFGLGLLVAVAAATMDLALDALAVELTNAQRKPMAASLKLAALALGSMIGGGVFVAVLGRMGWQFTFLCVAALMLLSLVPVLGLVKQEGHHSAGSQSQEKHWFACLRQAHMRRYLLLLVVCAGVIFPLSALNRVMLVDIQVPMEHIAWLVGSLQPIGLMAIALLATPLIRSLGHRAALALLTLAGVLCTGLLIAGYLQGWQTVAIVGTVGMSTVVGGLMVVYSALILRWSEGPQAATNYAVLFCGTRLSGIVMSVLAGKLVATMSWPVFYGAGMAALILSSLWMLKRLQSEREAASLA